VIELKAIDERRQREQRRTISAQAFYYNHLDGLSKTSLNEDEYKFIAHRRTHKAKVAGSMPAGVS
jgi:hypothetical protein